MGKGIVEKLKEKYEIELIHKGFEIHPDVPEEGILLEAYFPNAKNMFDRLQAFGQHHGITFNDITMMPNTNKALRLAEYAKTIGVSEQLNTLLYDAVFVKNLNISQEDVLTDLAKEVGIENVGEILLKNEYKDTLQENKDYCASHNITSVPTFIVNDRYAIVGSQDSEAFKKVFDLLSKEAL